MAKSSTQGARTPSLAQRLPAKFDTYAASIAVTPCRSPVRHNVDSPVVKLSDDRVCSRFWSSNSRMGGRTPGHVSQREARSYHPFKEGIRCVRFNKRNHIPHLIRV